MGHKKDDDGDIRLVCSRVEGYEGATARGSTKSTCGLCRKEVFVSPSSRNEMKHARKVDIVCVPCFNRTHKLTKEDTIYFAQDAPREVVEALHDEARARAEKN